MNEEINQSYFDIEFENNDQICIGQSRRHSAAQDDNKPITNEINEINYNSTPNKL